MQIPIITIYQGETSKEFDLITSSLQKENINFYKNIDPSGHPGRGYRNWDRDYFPFEIKILQKDETFVRQIIADLEITKQLIRPQPRTFLNRHVLMCYFWIVILFLCEIFIIIFSS
ncbi:MAG: hypothetical protein LLG04_09330 [Parachlamydia sp.]|nr:hypothetical protein [Parachlamydia sp.]